MRGILLMGMKEESDDDSFKKVCGTITNTKCSLAVGIVLLSC